MPPVDFTTRTLEARRARGIQVAAMLAAAVVVLRLTPGTRNFPLFPLIEGFAYDLVFGMARPEPPSDIAIVEIDDVSLKALGRFQSWHRDKYAQLLDRLRGAKVVAFDILFPERDEQDDVFAAAIQRHGRVVLAAHWSPAAEPPEKWAQQFGYRRSAGRLARGKVGETIEFPSTSLKPWNAASIGYVDLEPDADGVYRRFRPLMHGPDGWLYPHFGTAIASVAVSGLTALPPSFSAQRSASGERGTAAAKGDAISQAADRNVLQVGSEGRELPIGADGTCLINYCGPTGTVPRVRFADVLRNPKVAESLSGKIVIVGATAPGLYDIRPAPYRQQGRMFFGVESNANIVNSILHRRPLREASGALAWAWGLLALVLGLTVGLVIWNAGETLAALVSVGILLLLAAPAFLVGFFWLSQWIPYSAILLATALPLVVGLPERLTLDKRLVQRQFSTYVSPDVLKELMDNPEVLRTPQRREVTLLFADVRGSTTLSENIPPEVWVAQLNEYLTQMSLAIFSFDGYLDKFMGDGIMAVWNAFGNQPDHAQRAVRAGLQMLRRLELLNKKWAQMEDRTPFRIGIGLHTGEPVMGNVGSEERTQFTAIGDAVNTAARIESMCKEFGSAFIISEETARHVANLFELRELGETDVRGRAAKVHIYEVVGERRQ